MTSPALEEMGELTKLSEPTGAHNDILQELSGLADPPSAAAALPDDELLATEYNFEPAIKRDAQTGVRHLIGTMQQHAQGDIEDDSDDGDVPLQPVVNVDPTSSNGASSSTSSSRPSSSTSSSGTSSSSFRGPSVVELAKCDSYIRRRKHYREVVNDAGDVIGQIRSIGGVFSHYRAGATCFHKDHGSCTRLRKWNFMEPVENVDRVLAWWVLQAHNLTVGKRGCQAARVRRATLVRWVVGHRAVLVWSCCQGVMTSCMQQNANIKK